MSDIQIKIGVDQFDKLWPRKLKGSRVGLLVHPASVNRKLKHTVELFIKSKNFELKVLFGPQHGIYGETQDNMIEWEGFLDPRTNLPVFSLYGHTRKPELSMLQNIDVLVIDLQDIGSRYYTFIWTMDLCMQSCMEMNKSIIILDRPNPIGGHLIEGVIIDMTFSSFVGQRPLPVRHGMTIGEIGNYLCNEFYPSLDFHIIPMRGWKRKMWFDETGLPWVMPSPNMPTQDTAIVYPGMCLLEGANISEGRGTTRPFEIFGAPFIDPYILVNCLEELNLPGVIFRPMFFQPTFQKYIGKLCGGAQIHITNRERFKPFKTGVAVIKATYDLYSEPSRPSPTPPIKRGEHTPAPLSRGETHPCTPLKRGTPSPLVGEGKGEGFEWKKPPYEYETQKMPIDILAGTDRLRKDIEKGEMLNRMEEWWHEECMEFNREFRKKYLIYK